jgi:cAMP-dependent protein kinase regulator
MFTSLDSSQWNVVLDAMQETEFKAGVNIVVQGEEGDFFYVLDSGEAEAYVVKDGNAPYLMKTYSSGESFGELSLMYNSPSGTTITAKTDCKCWALDRISFKNLLKITTGDRQQRYEDFLHRVPILQSLTLLELHRIADAVVEKTFEDGEWIIRQGDIGDRFYIITEGNARVYKTYNDGNSVDLAHLSSGGYFGELALVTDNPRAANVVAVGKLVTVTLDRGAFTRLLGPITDILKRSKEEYENIERRLYNAKMEQMRNSVHLPSQNN